MHCIDFDMTVTVTHCTSPIKVGATVGIVFLHVKPDDESQLEALPFKLRKPREMNIGREESRIDSLTD